MDQYADDLSQKLHDDHIFIGFIGRIFDLHPFSQIDDWDHILSDLGQSLYLRWHAWGAEDIGWALDHLLDLGHIDPQDPLVDAAVFELFKHPKIDHL